MLDKRKDRHRRRYLPIIFAAAAGSAVAVLVGVAIAKTFTLQIAKRARVTNAAGQTLTEGILVNSKARAVYYLTGDRKRHPKCTKRDSCFTFWPPVTVSSPKKLSKASGIHGKLGLWHRNGLFQVTLGGHPLYTFSADRHTRAATGEGMRSFGGTWHVIKTSAPLGATSTTGSTAAPTTTATGTTTTTNATSMTSTTTTTTTTSCAYPPYYC